VLSAESEPVDVPVDMATDVDDETAVVRLPDTVRTVVYSMTLLDVEVYSDVKELEAGALVVVVFLLSLVDVDGVLDGVEDGAGVDDADDGVELGGVEEGVLLGVLLRLADDWEEDWEIGVDDGVDDTGTDEGVELTADDCDTFGSVLLLEVAATALLLSSRANKWKSNQLACAIAKKRLKTVNSRNCRRESILTVLLKWKEGNVSTSYLK